MAIRVSSTRTNEVILTGANNAFFNDVTASLLYFANPVPVCRLYLVVTRAIALFLNFSKCAAWAKFLCFVNFFKVLSVFSGEDLNACVTVSVYR